VPGAFTKGTNHFQHAMKPGNEAVAAIYSRDPTADMEDKLLQGTKSLESDDADPSEVGRAVFFVHLASIMPKDARRRD
jgi:hypothetical protein